MHWSQSKWLKEEILKLSIQKNLKLSISLDIIKNLTCLSWLTKQLLIKLQELLNYLMHNCICWIVDVHQELLPLTPTIIMNIATMTIRKKKKLKKGVSYNEKWLYHNNIIKMKFMTSWNPNTVSMVSCGERFNFSNGTNLLDGCNLQMSYGKLEPFDLQL